MPWPQKGATHYHSWLGLSDKGRAIKGLVVCYVVWLGTMIYEMDLWTSAVCVSLSLIVVRITTSSSTATPHRYMQIQYNTMHNIDKILYLVIAAPLIMYIIVYKWGLVNA